MIEVQEQVPGLGLCYVSGTQGITEVLEQCLEAPIFSMVAHCSGYEKKVVDSFVITGKNVPNNLPCRQGITLSQVEKKLPVCVVSVKCEVKNNSLVWAIKPS